jgi:formiminotetrahydrofolate cyclodeaminase
MDVLADRSLGQVLDQVAADTAAPGGGSSCALTCALAAGLVEMTAGLTLTRREYAARHTRMAEIRARAGELRTEALALAELELHVYGAVLEALRIPEDQPGRAEAVEAAMSNATDSPLAISRAAAEVAELAAEAARTGNIHLHGDASAGAVLAEAACAASARLVELNLTERPEDPRRKEAAELPRRALQARLAARSANRDV